MPTLSLAHIEHAQQVLNGRIIRTPLIYSPTFSRMTGAQVFLKLENLQKTGSFKSRGATYKIISRLPEIGSRGVVAASAGNHAQGVALAARQASLPATIVMPEWASITKQEATRGYGGQVILRGESINESIGYALELAKEGGTFIHPYDDLDIITGQGTIGLEILQELPDADAILVPVGGGGLISGIATAAKAIRPQIKVFGVQAAACPSAYRAFKLGRTLLVDAAKSIADGIAVKRIGELNFPVIQEKVDGILLVEEDQIAAAMLLLLERKKVLAEGAGVVPLAAMLNDSAALPGNGKIVLVISGGNVDSPLVGRIIRQGLFRDGRLMRFAVLLDDVPGSLARILTLIAEQKANVLHIDHTRIGRSMPINVSRVELEIETRGPGHIRDISEKLEAAGYRIFDDAFDLMASGCNQSIRDND
ncbi:threonine ammonia-lyase [Desulfoferrobacter suflitae]|uniref:threonine ammonia-lyase n=1 Tax=Desulfoferrobacter suflitae TaxID=2865782 RepID=UPI0021640E9A|nr:threonine ammonia-lyase [Desulfoferrobacter suflitae]MCK8601886.1 threonine ammonia-lyase [Desulfoferrobacter suflitae]